MISFQMSKRLPIIFLCIFLFSSLAVTFHIHHDAASHNECPLCILSVNTIATLPHDVPQISATHLSLHNTHLNKDVLISYISKKAFSVRAPPS